MLTADVNLNEFSRSLNQRITRLRIDSSREVKRQAAELTKTLVKLSPPKTLAIAKKRAAKDVAGRFARQNDKWFKGEQVGKKGMRWLFASPWVLVGVKADDYFTVSNPKSAKRLLYHPRGESKYTRLGQRGVQIVSRANKDTLRKPVFNALVNNLKNNFGRLKAGWLVGVFQGKLQLTGGNRPPAWVTKHAFGARGAADDNTNTPSNPSFTIINRAKGVSSEQVKRIASIAVRIRAKAMKADTALILQGKKAYNG